MLQRLLAFLKKGGRPKQSIEKVEPSLTHEGVPWVVVLTVLAVVLHLVLLLRAHGSVRRLSRRLMTASKDWPTEGEAKIDLTGGGATPSRQVAATTADPDVQALAALPLVSDLMREHSVQLDQLRRSPELTGLLQPAVHDDLFLLRYLLSAKGNVPKAAQKLQKGIEWRRENAAMLSAAALERVRVEAGGWTPTATLPWRTRSGQPVAVAAPFLADLDAKPEDFHFKSGIANREESYSLCDELTRKTGRLHKLVIIQDFHGFSFRTALRHSRFMKLQGKLSKLSESLYPQLVATVVIAHPPALINRLHAMAKPMLSKKLLEKMRIAATIEAILKETGMRLEHLPTFLGGKFTWTAVDWG